MRVRECHVTINGVTLVLVGGPHPVAVGEMPPFGRIVHEASFFHHGQEDFAVLSLLRGNMLAVSRCRVIMFHIAGPHVNRAAFPITQCQIDRASALMAASDAGDHLVQS